MRAFAKYWAKRSPASDRPDRPLWRETSTQFRIYRRLYSGLGSEEYLRVPDVLCNVNANEVLMRVYGHRRAEVDGDAGHCRVCSNADLAGATWIGC